MTEQESSPYPHLPRLPEPWPRPADLMPSSPPPVDAGAPLSTAVVPSAAVTAEGAADAAKEQERVHLTGRLGQNPTIRTSRNGVLIARFPIGVKDETDLSTTTWHQVLAFRERAAWVQDTLHRGDAVEVIGYTHQREIPGRNGPRTVDEIYATVIKQRS